MFVVVCLLACFLTSSFFYDYFWLRKFLVFCLEAPSKSTKKIIYLGILRTNMYIKHIFNICAFFVVFWWAVIWHKIFFNQLFMFVGFELLVWAVDKPNKTKEILGILLIRVFIKYFGLSFSLNEEHSKGIKKIQVNCE